MERINLPEHMAAVERELIRAALAATSGNKTRAAALLGIQRTTLLMKIARLSANEEEGQRQ
jgi:sigma-54 specific flagellar transcriptional regulator A